MRVAIQAAADKQLADAKQQVRPTQTTWSYLVFSWQVFFLSLAAQAAETLIYSLVTSEVDYCNSLPYGVPNQLIQKLQTVQNSEARLLTYTNTLEHIKRLLKHLHWLLVEFRIQYKILLINFEMLKWRCACLSWRFNSPEYTKPQSEVRLKKLLSAWAIPPDKVMELEHSQLQHPFSGMYCQIDSETIRNFPYLLLRRT